MADEKDNLALSRWRLVLGRFAEQGIGAPGLTGQAGRMDRVLDYLYGREYGKRNVRTDDRRGGSEESQLLVPEWLTQVRDLFPKDTVEIVERHALERYKMTELVTDEPVLQKLQPNYEFLKAVL